MDKTFVLRVRLIGLRIADGFTFHVLSTLRFALNRQFEFVGLSCSLASWPAFASVPASFVRSPSQSERFDSYLENDFTKNHQFLWEYPYRSTVISHRIWRIYFRPEVIAKKNCRKCGLWWLRGVFRWFFKATTKFYKLFGDNQPNELLLAMTLLAASVRLQNAIKYCTKVRKTDLPGKESRIIRPCLI